MSERKKGSTGVSLLFRLTDSVTGAAKSGIDVTTLKLQYERPGEAASTATSLTLLAALTTTHTDYGAIEVDSTNSKGVYRVDCPDAGFATGADEVTWSVSGTGIETSTRLISLITVDPYIAGGKLPVTLASTDVTGNVPADAKAINAVPTSNVTAINANVGTAQPVNFTGSGASAYVKSSLTAILGTLLTETVAGYLTAGFKFLFNVATPTFNVTSVNQTGDSYARIGAPAGASVSADVAAVQTAVGNINNLSALANLFAPGTLVRPSSSSIVYPFTFAVKDVEGHLVDVDSNTVTLTATNAAGTDRSANLSTVTHAGTGEYTFTYTVSSTHADEGLRITAAGTVQSATRKAYANCEVADADSLSALAAIQAQTAKLTFDGSNNVLSAPQTDFSAMMKLSLNAATPTVTLAPNQHVIVDSGTVTTLTNLPAITTGWLTAAGIAANALNGKGDWSTYAGGDTLGTATLLTRLTQAVLFDASGYVKANAEVVGDKTGYALSSGGLDSISTTAPSGVASNFREMLVAVYRRLFGKATLTSSQLKTYADDGTTVITTQALLDDGVTQTQGSAS